MRDTRNLEKRPREEDSENQYKPEKRPQGEASSSSRLNPDHAARQYQLYDQRRLQERQSNGNQDTLESLSHPQGHLPQQNEGHYTENASKYYESSELNIDNFEICTIELREYHDQAQATSYQSLPEIQQPLANRKEDIIDISSDSDNESSHKSLPEVRQPLVVPPETQYDLVQQYAGRYQADPSSQCDKDENKYIEQTIHDIMNEEGIFQKEHIKGILSSRALFDKKSAKSIRDSLEKEWKKNSRDLKKNRYRRYKNLLKIINELEA